MRLHLQLSKNSTAVPFDHLPVLVGALHKWLGPNELHGGLSLYSFSWLKGAERNKDGLNFRNGSSFFVSAHEELFIKNLLKGIMRDPSINWGMEVLEVALQDTPSFTGQHTFQVASPVLVKRRLDEREHHYSFSDTGVDELLTETLRSKLEHAGLDDDTLQVKFDRAYRLPKTKKVNYKGIGNMTNMCPVIVQGKPESVAFAWNVGIGNSTGIGLGALT